MLKSVPIKFNLNEPSAQDTLTRMRKIIHNYDRPTPWEYAKAMLITTLVTLPLFTVILSAASFLSRKTEAGNLSDLIPIAAYFFVSFTVICVLPDRLYTRLRDRLILRTNFTELSPQKQRLTLLICSASRGINLILFPAFTTVTTNYIFEMWDHAGLVFFLSLHFWIITYLCFMASFYVVDAMCDDGRRISL